MDEGAIVDRTHAAELLEVHNTSNKRSLDVYDLHGVPASCPYEAPKTKFHAQAGAKEGSIPTAQILASAARDELNPARTCPELR